MNINIIHIPYFIFNFAMNHDVYSAQASSNVAENNNSNTVSIRAVACIQEVLSRPCIPPALNPLLVHVVRSCCVLVQHMLSPSTTARPHLQGGGGGGARQRLAALHPTFLDKVTELIRLLVAGHFRRLEQQPLFNVEEFLALLFRYVITMLPESVKVFRMISTIHFCWEGLFLCLLLLN